MKKKNFLRFAAIAVSAVVLVACSGAEYLDLGKKVEEKNLEVSTSVNDGQGESTGSFEQSSTVDLTGDGTDVQRFNPLTLMWFSKRNTLRWQAKLSWRLL